MELIDLSLGWVFVVSWVFAKDDFFKTSNSLSAPFVDFVCAGRCKRRQVLGCKRCISCRFRRFVCASRCKRRQVLGCKRCISCRFRRRRIGIEVTSIDLFFGTGLKASVTTMVPVNVESFDTAKSEFDAWGTWQTDT